MTLKVLCLALCSLTTVIAGEYGYHELPLISPHLFGDISGGDDFEHGFSFGNEDHTPLFHGFFDGHENIFNEHGDILGHDISSIGIPEDFHPSQELHLDSSHISGDSGLDWHDNHYGHGPTSYVKIKGHDNKGMTYLVEHTGHKGISSVGDHSVDGGGGHGSNSYAVGHGTSYVNIKQHPVKSESYTVLHHGGGGDAETKHIHDSSHTYAQGFGHGTAVSTTSFKDYTGKGASYTVQQTHGHDAAATVTGTKAHAAGVLHGNTETHHVLPAQEHVPHTDFAMHHEFSHSPH